MADNKNFTVEKIVNICSGKLVIGTPETVIIKYVHDTRTIEQGDMFVGVKGDNFDGSEYYKEALNKGAIGCILENVSIEQDVIEKYSDRNIIIVEDTILALQKLAEEKRNLYNIPVVAVTGSVGKTSTKDIIASVLEQEYNVLKTEGNFNNHIGLPLTILRLQEHDAMVIEMGMNHFGEIRVLTNIAKPTIGVITNIGTAHIGILGSRENILKAKLEMLEGISNTGTIIINNDNDLLHNWNKEKNDNIKVKTVGINNKSDYEAKNISTGVDGSTFDIQYKEGNIKVEVPIGGEHFVYNSLIGICVSDILGEDKDKAVKGIKEFKLTKRRMEILKTKKEITFINDTYNASYDSMKPAIEYLKNAEGLRKIAVLGDMLELGDYEEELHEKVGEEVAKNKIDILITVGELAKSIEKKAHEKGLNTSQIIHYANSEEATNGLKEILQPGDLVLLKASNLMKLYKIAEELAELYNK